MVLSLFSFLFPPFLAFVWSERGKKKCRRLAPHFDTRRFPQCELFFFERKLLLFFPQQCFENLFFGGHVHTAQVAFRIRTFIGPGAGAEILHHFFQLTSLPAFVFPYLLFPFSNPRIFHDLNRIEKQVGIGEVGGGGNCSKKYSILLCFPPEKGKQTIFFAECATFPYYKAIRLWYIFPRLSSAGEAQKRRNLTKKTFFICWSKHTCGSCGGFLVGFDVPPQMWAGSTWSTFVYNFIKKTRLCHFEWETILVWKKRGGRRVWGNVSVLPPLRYVVSRKKGKGNQHMGKGGKEGEGISCFVPTLYAAALLLRESDIAKISAGISLKMSEGKPWMERNTFCLSLHKKIWSIQPFT